MSESRRSDSRCPDTASLERLVVDQVDGRERRRLLRHARNCPTCREIFYALWLAETPGTPMQEALLASALEMPARRLPAALARTAAFRAFRNAVTIAALVCTAGVGLLLSAPGDAPNRAIVAFVPGARPIEGRLSMGLPHAPYRPVRGDRKSFLDLDRALSRLLAMKQQDPSGSAQSLATVYLLRSESGDLERADTELLSLPPGPERDNDRAVLLLAQGHVQEAIKAARAAIGARSDFAPARFNLALALEAADRKTEAARAFRDYLAIADVTSFEKPWIAEARERLARIESVEAK